MEGKKTYAEIAKELGISEDTAKNLGLTEETTGELANGKGDDENE